MYEDEIRRLHVCCNGCATLSIWFISVYDYFFPPGTAHCANMYPELPTDPPQLIQARLKIKDHISSWLTAA